MNVRNIVSVLELVTSPVKTERIKRMVNDHWSFKFQFQSDLFWNFQTHKAFIINKKVFRN